MLLRNLRAVLPERIVERADILIQDRRIAEVSESPITESRNNSQPVLDLEGLTVFPGFIDVHIHGALGVDLMDTDANGLERISRFLVSQGTTAWLPTLVPAKPESYKTAVSAIDEMMLIQRVAAGSLMSARALGVHYEGPFVNIAQCGALHSDFFQTFMDAAQVDALPVPTSDETRKMITVAPEIEGGVSLIRELARRGWIVSIGHTRAPVEILENAWSAGARHMTHFMNAMAPLHHRAPGPIGWGLGKDEVTCDFIVDGVHLDPFVVDLLVKLKGSNQLLLISDAVAAAGMGDGDYEIWGEKITVKGGRTSNVRGSIAGSVITVLDAVKMLFSLRVSEVDVARMASGNPARLLGLESECGSIEVGKRADLVALDQEQNVVLTLVGGIVVFER